MNYKKLSLTVLSTLAIVTTKSMQGMNAAQLRKTQEYRIYLEKVKALKQAQFMHNYFEKLEAMPKRWPMEEAEQTKILNTVGQSFAMRYEHFLLGKSDEKRELRFMLNFLNKFSETFSYEELQDKTRTLERAVHELLKELKAKL